MENNCSTENKKLGGTMTTDVLEKVAINTNGDKYWVKQFNADDSIEHVKLFERQGLGAKIKCGLELWRAKLTLGQGAWYPYLFKCGMSQPTSSRRKNLAELFLRWCGIKEMGETLNQTHIIKGLELVFSESFILNDFQDVVFELNRDNIVDSLQVAAGGTLTRQRALSKSLGFVFSNILKGISTIELTLHEWDDAERSEVKQTLGILIDGLQTMLKQINEFELIKSGGLKKSGLEKLDADLSKSKDEEVFSKN